MATIVTREVGATAKGSPLTNAEFDNNIINLNTDKAEISETVQMTDIGTAPNEISLNQFLGDLAFQDSRAVVLKPQPSVVPAGVGDMVFQLTNDTTLVVKVKGSDGTVRSATLTLA
jgi:hypothetical protein